MKSYSLAVAAFAATAGTALAATISTGTASYTWIDPWSGSTTGNGTFITGSGISDQLFKNTWYYRTQGNNQNRVFSSIDSPTVSTSGDTATISYSNAGPGVAGLERFNAVFTVKIVQVASGQARVDTRLRFTASAANTSTRTYQIFNLVDLDLIGGSNAIAIQPGNELARYSTSSNVGWHAGYGATRWTTGSGSNVQSAIGSGSNNLSSSALATTADVASAFQWTLTLAPGQSADIYASFAINTNAVPAPGSLVLAGLGGLLAARRRR